MKRQVHVFPGFGIGGSQRRLAQIHDLLPDWSHHVLSLSGDTSALSLFGQGGRITAEAFPLTPSTGPSPRNIVRLGRKILASEPDLLCTYNWGAIEAVLANRLRLRLPHVHFEDGFGPDEASSRNRLRNAVRRVALSAPSVTVVPSQTLDDIAHTEWGLRVPDLFCIANGVDLDRYRPQARPRLARVEVGTVGALRPEKNVGRLIAACAQADLRLTVIGEGGERPRLEQAALTHGADVRFLGARSDTATTYGLFDIFALGSDTEQMPLTVIEAMASGLPIVAPDVGDIGRMVAPENRAFIVAPGDAEALSVALRHLARDPEKRLSLGKANRGRAETFYGETAMASRYGKLFDALLPVDSRG